MDEKLKLCASNGFRTQKNRDDSYEDHRSRRTACSFSPTAWPGGQAAAGQGGGGGRTAATERNGAPKRPFPGYNDYVIRYVSRICAVSVAVGKQNRRVLFRIPVDSKKRKL